jgi:hypothetical protein
MAKKKTDVKTQTQEKEMSTTTTNPPKTLLQTLYEELPSLAADPDRYFGHLNIVADHLSDEGRQDAADALAWMVRFRKRPYSHPDGNSYAWFDESMVAPGLGDPESDVPAGLYKALEGGKAVANHTSFGGLKEAFDAAAAAWVKTAAAGWKADDYTPKPQPEEKKEEEKK